MDFASFTNEEWLQFFGLSFTIVAGLAAIFTYRRDVRHKRTDWLYQLFDKFYEKETYREIRLILDHKMEPQYSELIRQTIEPGPKNLDEKFSDYLNFFEFLVNLERTGRMSRVDLDNMFNYYLTSLGKQDWIRDYCARNGFEGLTSEFKRGRQS